MCVIVETLSLKQTKPVFRVWKAKELKSSEVACAFIKGLGTILYIEKTNDVPLTNSLFIFV